LSENFELNRAVGQWVSFLVLCSLSIRHKEKSTPIYRQVKLQLQLCSSIQIRILEQINGSGKMVSFAAFLDIRTKKSSQIFPFLKKILSIFRFSERKGFYISFFFSKSPRSARPALSKIAIATPVFFYGYMN